MTENWRESVGKSKKSMEYRAWDKHQKKWVTDNVVINSKGEVEIREHTNIRQVSDVIIDNYIEIDDINKKKIFESDIVKGEHITMSCGDEDDDYEKITTYGIGYIEWGDKGEGEFQIVCPMASCKYVDKGLVKLYPSTLKVIGNLHENFDIIKEETHKEK